MKDYISKPKLSLLLYLSILVGILTIIVIIPKYFNNGCVSYSCLLFPDKNLLRVKDVYENTKYTWRGLLTHPNYIVRLYKQGNVKASDADQFTKITSMNINGLFDTARSPYAGEISDKITCPDNLKPVAKDLTSSTGIKIHHISSFLNDRMQYGACTENQIAYNVSSGIFYCPNTAEWYQIEIITPTKGLLQRKTYEDLFLNAGCINAHQ